MVLEAWFYKSLDKPMLAFSARCGCFGQRILRDREPVLKFIKIATLMLKSTTRHVHIFAAEVQAEVLYPSDRKLTLDIDPDNEFIWNDVALQKVYSEFERLGAQYSGQALSDYNLRRIGSDLENFIRSLLQKGEIAYNLDSRVLNFSMGRPQVGGSKS